MLGYTLLTCCLIVPLTATISYGLVLYNSAKLHEVSLFSILFFGTSALYHLVTNLVLLNRCTQASAHASLEGDTNLSCFSYFKSVFINCLLILASMLLPPSLSILGLFFSLQSYHNETHECPTNILQCKALMVIFGVVMFYNGIRFCIQLTSCYKPASSQKPTPPKTLSTTILAKLIYIFEPLTLIIQEYKNSATKPNIQKSTEIV